MRKSTKRAKHAKATKTGRKPPETSAPPTPTPAKGDAPKDAAPASAPKRRGPGRPRIHPEGKHRRSKAERRGQPVAELSKRIEQQVALDLEYLALTTDDERIAWLARVGAEADDIATKLGLHTRLATDATFKERFGDIFARGRADMRIELAKTILNEARVGQVSALGKMAVAHLAAFKDEAPSTEFASGYRAKVEELLAKIHDDQHGHIRAKFRFEEGPGPSPVSVPNEGGNHAP